MKYELNDKHIAYLQSQVTAGAYASIEEAMDAHLSPPADDSWMKPFVDEALLDVQAGNAAPWSVDDLRAELHSRYLDLANGTF